MNFKSFVKNLNKRNFSIAFALLFSLILLFSPSSSGAVMLVSVILFGYLSSTAKDSKTKLIALFCLAFISLIVVLFTPLKMGVDFKGGIRVPLTLQEPVDEATMELMVSEIKRRLSDFLGLKAITVRGVGNNQIHVEFSEDDEELLQKLEKIVEKQGIFEGIVDGEVVLRGENIIEGTVSRVPPSFLDGATWGVSFSIDRKAAEEFAQKVKGKGGKPLYMFLDRPKNALIVIPKDELLDSAPPGLEIDALLSLRDSLVDMELVFDEEFNLSMAEGKNVLVYKDSKWVDLLKDNENVTVFYDLPSFLVGSRGVVLDKWEAIGLLSSPILGEEVTSGNVVQVFTISGNSPPEEADEEARLIETILKGGSLPVKVFTGSKTQIPSKLGERFFYYSFFGLVVALLTVSLFVSLRYRRVKLIVPMIIITFVEVLILFALVGSFNLDLASMAGIIAVVGVSIDSQIVITDELLRRGRIKEKLEKAFEIIKVNALIIIVSMFPLIFSPFVEIIGFATSTILGALLGVLVSRPAYASLVELFLKDEIKKLEE